MIVPRITVDHRAFDIAFKKYVSLNKRDLSYLIPYKLFRIAVSCFNLTENSDPSKIESKLGVMILKVNKTKISKTGKVRIVSKKQLARIDGYSLAETIIQSRQYNAGKEYLVKTELKKAAMKMIAARKASVRFLKSGWIPAIKYLKGKFKGSPGIRTIGPVKKRGVDKGGALLANMSGWNPFGEIWNSVKSNNNKVYNKLMIALNKALKMEVADMIKYITGKLEKNAAITGMK